MFMLFFWGGGLEKKALLLVFVLLLARTAHLETFNREREQDTLLLLLTQPQPPHLASELSKAYFEVLRHGSLPSFTATRLSVLMPINVTAAVSL